MHACQGLILFDSPYSVVEHYCRLLNQMDVEVGDESVRLRRVCGDRAEPNDGVQ